MMRLYPLLSKRYYFLLFKYRSRLGLLYAALWAPLVTVLMFACGPKYSEISNQPADQVFSLSPIEADYQFVIATLTGVNNRNEGAPFASLALPARPEIPIYVIESEPSGLVLKEPRLSISLLGQVLYNNQVWGRSEPHQPGLFFWQDRGDLQFYVINSLEAKYRHALAFFGKGVQKDPKLFEPLCLKTGGVCEKVDRQWLCTEEEEKEHLCGLEPLTLPRPELIEVQHLTVSEDRVHVQNSQSALMLIKLEGTTGSDCKDLMRIQTISPYTKKRSIPCQVKLALDSTVSEYLRPEQDQCLIEVSFPKSRFLSDSVCDAYFIRPEEAPFAAIRLVSQSKRF